MMVVQCLGSIHLGDFHMAGAKLRKQGWNRIGNMLVPNSNYCAFEDWVMPILDQLLQEQQQHGTCWTPSKVLPTHPSLHILNAQAAEKFVSRGPVLQLLHSCL